MEEFSRTRALLGTAAMEKLAASRVAVFGLGGVGGYAAEALVRSGVGAIDLIDHDTICLSNINRQIFATHETLGQYKADAARARFSAISPSCKVTVHKIFFLPDVEFDVSCYDYVIDAIDTVTAKIEIVRRCTAAGVPVISAMGTGNKLDPTALEVTDIFSTSVCPLAKVMRRELRKAGVTKLKVVYSKEEPKTPQEDLGRTPGSVAFVPPVAGLILAGEVVKEIVS